MLAPSLPLPRVLLVDDERLVLDAMGSRLRRRVDVLTACSGSEALSVLAHERDVAVVVSDLRMPGMDGAELLAQVRARHPDVVRLLLTGHADVDAAIKAVNEGSVFRFLTKPCPANVFSSAVDAAVAQHRLIISERELLQKTLRGAVDALSEVLELTNPTAFSAGRRIRTLAVAMAQHLNLHEQVWVLELAALLGQLGAVTLSPEMAQRVFADEPLDDAERDVVRRVPEVSLRLLRHVPRLEPVIEAIELSAGPSPSLVANVLRLAREYYLISSRGLVYSEAFARLDHDDSFDRRALDALAAVQGLARKASRVSEVGLLNLQPGHVLADNVYTSSGALLLVKGHVLTESVLERLHNCARTGVREPVRIWQSDEG